MFDRCNGERHSEEEELAGSMHTLHWQFRVSWVLFVLLHRFLFWFDRFPRLWPMIFGRPSKGTQMIFARHVAATVSAVQIRCVQVVDSLRSFV